MIKVINDLVVILEEDKWKIDAKLKETYKDSL